MTNTWFVMIPPSYASASVQEKELTDFVISYPAGSQAWTDANAGKIIQGAEGNTGNPQVSEQLVKWQGPFATQAAAKTAASAQQQSANPVNDAVNAAENSTSLAGISSFFAALTQANTWIRVSKVIIGGILLIVGLAHITGADNTVSIAARKVPLPI